MRFVTSDALTAKAVARGRDLPEIASDHAGAVPGVGSLQAGVVLQVHGRSAGRAEQQADVSARVRRGDSHVEDDAVGVRLVGQHPVHRRVSRRHGRASHCRGTSGSTADDRPARRQLLGSRPHRARLWAAQPRGTGRAAAAGRHDRPPARHARRQGRAQPLRAGVLLGPWRRDVAGTVVSAARGRPARRPGPAGTLDQRLDRQRCRGRARQGCGRSSYVEAISVPYIYFKPGMLDRIRANPAANRRSKRR